MCIDFFFNTQRSWPGGCGRSYEIYNISIVWIIYNNPCAYIRYLVHLSLRAMVVPAVYNRHNIYIYTNIYTCDIYKYILYYNIQSIPTHRARFGDVPACVLASRGGHLCVREWPASASAIVHAILYRYAHRAMQACA